MCVRVCIEKTHPPTYNLTNLSCRGRYVCEVTVIKRMSKSDLRLTYAYLIFSLYEETTSLQHYSPL